MTELEILGLAGNEFLPEPKVGLNSNQFLLIGAIVAGATILAFYIHAKMEEGKSRKFPSSR